jgi:hypothetical protein
MEKDNSSRRAMNIFQNYIGRKPKYEVVCDGHNVKLSEVKMQNPGDV